MTPAFLQGILGGVIGGAAVAMVAMKLARPAALAVSRCLYNFEVEAVHSSNNLTLIAYGHFGVIS